LTVTFDVTTVTQDLSCDGRAFPKEEENMFHTPWLACSSTRVAWATCSRNRLLFAAFELCSSNAALAADLAKPPRESTMASIKAALQTLRNPPSTGRGLLFIAFISLVGLRDVDGDYSTSKSTFLRGLETRSTDIALRHDAGQQ
jgi:hypothetical protein